MFLSAYRNFKYYVFVHDIDFYIINTNPFGATKYYEFDGSAMTNHYREIALVKHKKLNLEHRPCEEAEDYKFLDCVKESFATQVGCRLPWDERTTQILDVCIKREQFQQFETLFMLSLTSEIDAIQRKTGCKTPCTYKEYTFLDTVPKKMTGIDGFVHDKQIAFGFWAATENTETKEEVPEKKKQDQTGLERSAISTLGRSRGRPAGSKGERGRPTGSQV